MVFSARQGAAVFGGSEPRLGRHARAAPVHLRSLQGKSKPALQAERAQTPLFCSHWRLSRPSASLRAQVTLHILSAGAGKPMGLDSPLSVWFTGLLADGSHVQHPWTVSPQPLVRLSAVGCVSDCTSQPSCQAAFPLIMRTPQPAPPCPSALPQVPSGAIASARTTLIMHVRKETIVGCRTAMTACA